MILQAAKLAGLWSRLTGKPVKSEPVDTAKEKKLVQKVGIEIYNELHKKYASLALAYILEEAQKKDFELDQIAYLLWVLNKSKKTWPPMDRHQMRLLQFFLNLIIRAGKLPNYKELSEPVDGETELQINEIIKNIGKRCLSLKNLAFADLVGILKKHQKSWGDIHKEVDSKNVLGHFSNAFREAAQKNSSIWSGEAQDTIRQFALMLY